MPNHETAAVDRIPLARSVAYAVKGVPDVPAEHTKGLTLAPTEITLTYRSTTDSQLGRVHAYVKGWWMRNGERYPTEKPMGQHYYGGPDGWPAWLAEEARLHDPEAAVSVPPPAPRADDRAAVLEDRDSYHRWLKEAETARDEARLQLSRVIGERNRLAAEVDSLLQQEADRIVAHCPDHGTADGVWMDCHCAVADDMRRNAVGPCVAGEQQNETPEATLAAALDGLHTLIATSSRDWGQYRVDAWLWAVLVGWDCEEQHDHDELCDNGAAMAEMQRMHGWDDEAVAKARRYRAAVRAITAPAVVAQPGKEPS